MLQAVVLEGCWGAWLSKDSPRIAPGAGGRLYAGDGCQPAALEHDGGSHPEAAGPGRLRRHGWGLPSMRGAALALPCLLQSNAVWLLWEGAGLCDGAAMLCGPRSCVLRADTAHIVASEVKLWTWLPLQQALRPHSVCTRLADALSGTCKLRSGSRSTLPHPYPCTPHPQTPCSGGLSHAARHQRRPEEARDLGCVSKRQAARARVGHKLAKRGHVPACARPAGPRAPLGLQPPPHLGRAEPACCCGHTTACPPSLLLLAPPWAPACRRAAGGPRAGAVCRRDQHRPGLQHHLPGATPPCARTPPRLRALVPRGASSFPARPMS